MNYGIKVSTTGVDVREQTDKNLSFTTKYGGMKILRSGTLSVTTDGSGNGTSSYAHNLGFAPAYIAYQKRTVQWTTLDASSYTNGYVPDPGTANQWGSDYHHTLHVYTDGTSIYLQAKGSQASTTYTIRYILFADLAQSYSGGDNLLNNDYGFKVAKQGYNVESAKQYQLGYSSQYKALQYYDVNYKTTTLTLPKVWASPVDTYADEGTYIDINHGLGYPPLFLSYFRSGSSNTTVSMSIPYIGVNSIDNFAYGVGAFCDATKVRISFWRASYFVTGSPNPNYNYNETITIKCHIFTEDLSKDFATQ